MASYTSASRICALRSLADFIICRGKRLFAVLQRTMACTYFPMLMYMDAACEKDVVDVQVVQMNQKMHDIARSKYSSGHKLIESPRLAK